jgi:hypothetical protein
MEVSRPAIVCSGGIYTSDGDVPAFDSHPWQKAAKNQQGSNRKWNQKTHEKR